ncbi:hypothetical protein HAV38_13960, partial [Glaciimonas immobilis]
EDRLFNHVQTPQWYEKNQGFEDVRHLVSHDSGRVLWHFKGIPEQLPVPAHLAQLTSGAWREARANPNLTECDGAEACPRTGIWEPIASDDHSLHSLVNGGWRQTWVVQGQAFPDPRHNWAVDIAAHDVMWRLIEAG